MTNTPVLLNMRQLGVQLTGKPSYQRIAAMKRDGFPMPGGRATLADAMKWLALHPNFSVNKRMSPKHRKELNQYQLTTTQ